MKRLVCLAVTSALLIGGGYALYKWSPAVRTLFHKTEKWATDKIGPDDVKREKIATHIKDLEAAIDRLDDEQFRATREAKKQAELIKKQNDKINDATAALEKVRDGLTTVSKSDSVSINGKDYSKADLEKVAKSIVNKHNDMTKALEDQKDTLKRIQGRADRMKTKKDELEVELAGLKKDLKAIDDKIKEIEELKRASAAMGDADKTVGDNLESLKKDVADLDASLDRRLNKEERDWSKVGKSGGDEADKFIEASKGSPDTLSEIDAILKGKK
jgi:DNA repair exonuclease SbcCD ATPase subunit